MVSEGRERPGVYIIESAGLFKIGYSVQPSQRIEGLKNSGAAPVRLVAIITCEDDDIAAIRKAEKALHRHFSEYRCHGEWFDLPDDWHNTIDGFWVAKDKSNQHLEAGMNA